MYSSFVQKSYTVRYGDGSYYSIIRRSDAEIALTADIGFYRRKAYSKAPPPTAAARISIPI